MFMASGQSIRRMDRSIDAAEKADMARKSRCACIYWIFSNPPLWPDAWQIVANIGQKIRSRVTPEDASIHIKFFNRDQEQIGNSAGAVR